MGSSAEINTRTVLLGSRGMIGSALSKIFAGPSLAAFSHQDLDITDYAGVEKMFRRLKPQLVLNAAAFTRVDDCEKFREAAFLVNTQAPAHLAELCRRNDAFFVHFSTDYVFDGHENRPYYEDHPANPLNYYGVTKWEADKKVMSSGCAHLILRSGWIFGKNGDNYVKKILRRAVAGAKLQAPSDQVGSPTYAEDVAKAVSNLLSVKATGVYNFSNQGHCTRLEQTAAILASYGLNNSVEAVKNDDLRLPAKRPSYSVLDLTRYMDKTGDTPRSWLRSTAEYIEFLKQNEHELRS